MLDDRVSRQLLLHPLQGACFWCSTFAHPWARAVVGPESLHRLCYARFRHWGGI